MEAKDVTASEFRYLQAIEQIKDEKGKVIMTDVADRLAFARASVYKKLLSLEQQGLIVKGCGKLIELTAKGKSEFEDVRIFTEKCRDVLAEHTGLDKKFLTHDSVSMACALSQRCRNALLSDVDNRFSQHNL